MKKILCARLKIKVIHKQCNTHSIECQLDMLMFMFEEWVVFIRSKTVDIAANILYIFTF